MDIMLSEENLNFQKYDLFFNAFLCHICKDIKTFDDCKTCSGCKLISYCGVEHQKVHWKRHKHFCKTTQKICKDINLDNIFFRADYTSPIAKEDWCRIRWHLKSLFESYLKRDLRLYEINMIFFPKVCKICGNTKTGKELTCTKCFSASYCSEDHKNLDNHERICPEFQKALNMDLFMYTESLESLRIELVKSGVAINACGMKSFILNYIHPNLSFGMEALVSQYYSSFLTLVYVMSSLASYVFSKQMIIHIVGASYDFEFQISEYWENLFHVYPELRSIKLILIGPEIENSPSILELCDACNSTNKMLRLFYYRQYYHDYFDNPLFLKPDIILSLNCGLHENENLSSDTWKNSLQFFLKFENVPVILTAYTELEAQKDVNRLLGPKIKCDKNIFFVKNCEKNPFSSLRPIKDWENEDDAVFYSNNYVTAFTVIPEKYNSQ